MLDLPVQSGFQDHISHHNGLQPTLLEHNLVCNLDLVAIPFWVSPQLWVPDPWYGVAARHSSLAASADGLADGGRDASKASNHVGSTVEVCHPEGFARGVGWTKVGALKAGGRASDCCCGVGHQCEIR